MFEARLARDQREMIRRHDAERRTLVMQCVTEFSRMGERRKLERRNALARDHAAVSLWMARFWAARHTY